MKVRCPNCDSDKFVVAERIVLFEPRRYLLKKGTYRNYDREKFWCCLICHKEIRLGFNGAIDLSDSSE